MNAREFDVLQAVICVKKRFVLTQQIISCVFSLLVWFFFYLQIQWYVNDGKCGLCGDDYRLEKPRPHENGGDYGSGVIVSLYKVGTQIPVSVYITANHKGYFVFDLCNLEKNPNESDECFSMNKLKLLDGSPKYELPNTEPGWFNTTLQLPKDLTCSQCVLRWTYITGLYHVIIFIHYHYRRYSSLLFLFFLYFFIFGVGNSWGTCPDGSGAVGCGPQETFRGCSDVRIIQSSKKVKRKFIINQNPIKYTAIAKTQKH